MRLEENESVAYRGEAALTDSAAGAASQDVIVLKFGSSVLGGTADLRTAVTEIYRHARRGRKVVAVVSAFAGETDALYEQAAFLGASHESRHAPRLIALGEERAAALLAIACEGTGLDARVAGARQIALRASGPVDDAHPHTADVEVLRQEIARHDVVIVPGFVAVSETGEPVLLGRGGTDLTAVFLAHVLGLGQVTLIKDVDGVYDRDPAGHAGAARLYRRLSWDKAREVAGKLLQPKAIDFAAARGVEIRVACANAASDTRVASHTDDPSLPVSHEPLRVAVAGLGVVGEGAALRLCDDVDYEPCGALVRDAAKPRSGKFAAVPIHTDIAALLGERPDVVIDALPSGPAGRALIEAALSQGVSVVTANKQAVAGALDALHGQAEAAGATLSYAASVGGGAPMVETVCRAAETGEIASIEAILNGTVNFILDSVASGEAFDAAVAHAQAAGFAEPDPSADLSGEDARAKIAILAYEAFGSEIDLDEIELEPLDAALARRFTQEGGVWKQIARIERRGHRIAAQVGFERVDDDGFFSATPGESNALRLETANGAVFACKGKGAGRRPTVESLLADLGEIKRAREGAEDGPALVSAAFVR